MDLMVWFWAYCVIHSKFVCAMLSCDCHRGLTGWSSHATRDSVADQARKRGERQTRGSGTPSGGVGVFHVKG